MDGWSDYLRLEVKGKRGSGIQGRASEKVRTRMDWMMTKTCQYV